MSAVKCNLEYQRCKTKNCRRSVEAYFQDGARCVSHSRLPIKAANVLIIYNNDQITVKLPDSQDQKSWTSVDAHFITSISTTCNHFIWHCISLLVFWQPLYHLHVLSPLSLHFSLIIHINISCKIYFKLSTNCRS